MTKQTVKILRIRKVVNKLGIARSTIYGQAVEAVAHVGDAGNKPDFSPCW